MIIVLTYLVAALLLGAYIAWFVYRYRREQRAKAAESQQSDQLLERTTPPLLGASPLPTMPSASRAVPTTPAAPSPSASAGERGARTVAEALSGISMPHDLVPLTSIAARPGVLDQVAFSSRVPPDVVGPAFADELERLGFVVTPLDETSLAARRENDNLVVYIDPRPATATEATVVIEVCVPY